MKTNGAPEKLYLLPNGFISYCRNTDEDVEYTDTDTFIERACEFIKDNGNHYIDIVNGQLILKKGIIKDFRKYIKGE